ncbi:sensor histidine kinase [Pseudoduganella eburnea]|uniref:Sensor histidine kinase n=1 Tax=Massilia eburnea TaxID=1776165 RepID=A0A6L6QEG5_9BURK|nr:histidine kinase [Massilia eburnea]MTW10762.1 sensor histidine kinase [Massilia eburnea]
MKREHYFWLLQVLGWTGVALFIAIVNKLRVMDMPLSGLCGIIGLAMTSLWRYCCKLRLLKGKRLEWQAAVAAALAVGMVQAFAIALLDRAISGANWFEGSPMWFLMMSSFWIGVMLAWNVCYMAALSLRRNQRLEAETLLLEAETLRLELLAKEAELRALQSQVNPHFFFNSLNSVRALMYEDVDNAADMIDRLATLMRYTLMSTFSDCVPLQHELDAVRAYLAIEQIRFEERLRLHVEIEAGLAEVKIPPMALQTLVENAVKYGVERRTEGSEIRIIARHVEGCAMIEVANQGKLLANPNSTRVGVNNARKRLELAKGRQATLDLSEQDGWVRATLSFPLAA